MRGYKIFKIEAAQGWRCNKRPYDVFPSPCSVEASPPPQLLGTSELNRTVVFAPDGMRDSMLAVAEANSMVSHFKNGIRHAGWLYKLVGKSPLDVNWKQYWVSALSIGGGGILSGACGAFMDGLHVLQKYFFSSM